MHHGLHRAAPTRRLRVLAVLGVAAAVAGIVPLVTALTSGGPGPDLMVAAAPPVPAASPDRLAAPVPPGRASRADGALRSAVRAAGGGSTRLVPASPAAASPAPPPPATAPDTMAPDTTSPAAPTAAPSPTAPLPPARPGATTPRSARTPPTVTPPPGPPAPAGTSTPTGGSPPAADPAVTRVIDLTNARRAQAGCPALTADARLAAAAQGHSADMAANGYFSHTSPDGRTPWDRIGATGYRFTSAAENIAAGQRTADEVVTAWMASPGHRANILNCSLRQLGVGLATDPAGTYGTYWTQDFATPR